MYILGKIEKGMFNTFKQALLSNSHFGESFSRFLRIPGVGRLFFRLSVKVKQIESFFGILNQRAVEYPWVIKHLPKKQDIIVLDVGCTESLLSHELIARGYRVVGLDVRNYAWRNRLMQFVQKDIIDTKLPTETFDLIVVVSTIEHIGLNCYNRLTLDNSGDIEAMHELHRLLKKGGQLILTTPYIGNRPFEVVGYGRRYNDQRLNKLIDNFFVQKAEFFYPRRLGHRIRFEKLNHYARREIAGRIRRCVVCLILSK